MYGETSHSFPVYCNMTQLDPATMVSACESNSHLPLIKVKDVNCFVAAELHIRRCPLLIFPMKAFLCVMRWILHIRRNHNVTPQRPRSQLPKLTFFVFLLAFLPPNWSPASNSSSFSSSLSLLSSLPADCFNALIWSLYLLF